MKSAPSSACWLLLLASCSSGDSVTGTVQGQGLPARDAIFQLSNFFTSQVVIALTSFPDACEVAGTAQLKADSGVLGLLVPTNGELPDAGTYLVGTGGAATAEFEETNASCQLVINPTTTGLAQSGTVTLSSVSSTAVSGSFDLTFQNGHLSGHFSAAACDAGTPTTQCAP